MNTLSLSCFATSSMLWGINSICFSAIDYLHRIITCNGNKIYSQPSEHHHQQQNCYPSSCKFEDRDISEAKWEEAEEAVLPISTLDLEDKVPLIEGGIDMGKTHNRPKRETN